MNKVYTLLLILIIAVNTQSCKKDQKPGGSDADGKTYLVTKITTHQLNADFVEQYEYDDNNRLVTAKYIGSHEYNYTYDTQNRLIKAGRNDYVNHFDTTFTYQYTTNKIIVTAKVNNQVNPADTYVYELANEHIVKAGVSGGEKAFIYNYDNNGNIIKVQELANGTLTDSEVFSYDDKHGPFAMTKGLNPHFMFVGSKPNYSFNNKTFNYFAGQVGINYKYNDAGFPISGSVAGDNRPEKITYEYLVR